MGRGQGLGRMQNALQECDTLTQADETDHDGNNDRQQAGDLRENTLHHVGGDDGGQLSYSMCTFLDSNTHGATSLEKDFEKFITKEAEDNHNEEQEKAGAVLHGRAQVLKLLQDGSKRAVIVNRLWDFNYLCWFR